MSTAPVPKTSLGKHAVVIGGSVGGLLSARVLSAYYDHVTVLERDTIPNDAEPRKSVPQGRHVHALFGGGVRVIERLFPRFFEELVAAGAVKCDFAKDLCWYHQGVWKLRVESDLVSYWQSRPFLEAHVRRRTSQLSNVTLVDQCEVTGLVFDEGKGRVVGVNVNRRDEGEREEALPADLVVHTGGRGSRLAEWLESAGYPRPEEQKVEVNIGYASRMYERPPDDQRDWKILATFATPPDRTRSSYLFPIEHGRWLATEVGFATDYPPKDDVEYLRFAESLEVPDFFASIKDAVPVTAISTFQFPAHRWFHYERLPRFPAGLIALGDAVCSFNPVYGQGMSSCALQVELLDRMLGKCNGAEAVSTRFARKFFRRSAKIIAIPWLLATTSDFLFPKTRGRQSLVSRVLKRYVVPVFELCSWNKEVLMRFYRVLHFLDHPRELFHPYVVFHVLKWRLGFRGGRTPSKQRPKK